MLKKRILLIGSLLVLSIAGQVLLRPCLGESQKDPTSAQDPALQTDQQEPLKRLDSLSNNETDTLHLDLLRTFFYMLGFVALIGAGGWLVCRKFSLGRTGSGGQRIRIGETVRMGPRKALHLIQVGSKTLLVGSSGDTLSLLADVSDSVNMPEDQGNV
ncbi:MAG: hypothetical protein GXY41_10655 [Phycisphaerae bacterium]|nr:hypothetical protein [Phycisphaerae bacterium]